MGHARFQARMGGQKRGAVKFRPVGEAGLSSDEEEEDDPFRSPPRSPTSPRVQRPWLRQKMSMASTTPTLVEDGAGNGKKDIDFDKEMGRVRGAKKRAAEGDGGAPEYSDFEEDLSTLASKGGSKEKDGKEWSPGFLNRARSGTTNGGSSSPSQRTAVSAGSPPLGAVPATPSLIKALDRIAVAQKDAFKPGEGMPEPNVGAPREGFKGARWEDFWRDVKDKAR